MQFDAVEHANLRGNTMARILNCVRCPLHEHAQPVTFRGASPNPYMIVGDAPGWQDNKYRRPFLGDVGLILDRALIDAPLPPLDVWFLANTVSCWPHGPPEKEHENACRDNLRAQIKLCDPEWVLLLGATALRSSQWCGEKITRMHGRPFLAEGGPYIDRKLFPTFHPAAGLRDPHILTEMRGDLSTLSSLISGKLPFGAVGVRIGRKGKIAA